MNNSAIVIECACCGGNLAQPPAPQPDLCMSCWGACETLARVGPEKATMLRSAGYVVAFQLARRPDHSAGVQMVRGGGA